MAKTHPTFRKRQRERALREKAQRKRERRAQRRDQKKESPGVVPEPSPVGPVPTEMGSTAGYEPEGETLPPADN
jgi:hypothetical protein